MDHIPTPEEERIGDIDLGGAPAAAFDASIRKRGKMVQEADPEAAKRLVQAEIPSGARNLRELFLHHGTLRPKEPVCDGFEAAAQHLTMTQAGRLEGRRS